MTRTPRVLVVDNYDSFVHTIVGYLTELGARCQVRRNDQVQLAEVAGADAVVVSPGPGRPQDAGMSPAVVRECAQVGIPTLGVCLGHQVIAVTFGAAVGQGGEPVHGRASPVIHDGSGVFAGVPSPFEATRYHSLCVEKASIPADLLVTARTPQGEVMALRHRSLPLVGVQFHPESVLTRHGHRLLGNWLAQVDG